MNIKEQIAKLPDDADLWVSDGVSIPYDSQGVAAADLKALADSHTQLLEAAKIAERALRELGKRLANDEWASTFSLRPDIEEAEKL